MNYFSDNWQFSDDFIWALMSVIADEMDNQMKSKGKISVLTRELADEYNSLLMGAEIAR